MRPGQGGDRAGTAVVAADPAAVRALLVCSSGGHLIQLHNLKPWWERHDRLWVTFEKLDSTSLLATEQVAWAYHPTTRNLANLARNTVYVATVKGGPSGVKDAAGNPLAADRSWSFRTAP